MNHKDLISEIELAIQNDRLVTIRNKTGKKIGFFTWWKKKDGILINNLIILPGYRRELNLLSMRKWANDMKSKYGKIYWDSRKRKRRVECIF